MRKYYQALKIFFFKFLRQIKSKNKIADVYIEDNSLNSNFENIFIFSY